MKFIEIRIKAKTDVANLEALVKEIRRVEKEYTCECTLLEIESTD